MTVAMMKMKEAQTSFQISKMLRVILMRMRIGMRQMMRARGSRMGMKKRIRLMYQMKRSIRSCWRTCQLCTQLLTRYLLFFLLISHRFTHIYSLKIQKLSFAIIHLTTKALPAWCKACTASKLPVLLIPRDVKTRWNSTYDMVKMAYRFRPAIDDITANKSLKLCRYELDDDDWKVIGDLLQVLKVCFSCNGVLFRC